MGATPPLTIDVLHDSNVGAARRAAREMAEKTGFDPTACEEIALAVTELASNLVKHAGGGTVTLGPISEGGRAGLEILSLDHGAGIVDVEQALGDRFSTAGTRGTGLGAVNRLMDELDIASERGRGTRIVCRKWVREQTVSLRPCPLAFGVATRPRQPGAENGDAFVLKPWAESTLVGVIDGLGHGQFAHRAAQVARQYVESHFDRPLDHVFRGVGRACRATRGVVMALARFDWGAGRMSFASVGNIEARVFPNATPYHFVVRRGVLGLNAPNPVVTDHPWPADHTLILHSDGLHSRWGWKDVARLAEQPAPALAQGLLRMLAKEDDDATVIVARAAVP